MDALKALIEKVDDGYLIGLCNKGIVKRAYKDLEQESPVLTWHEEEAHVALKEETCVIRTPLGESGCSCPSRSICRHIVTAILWMKREAKEAEGAQEARRAEGTAPEEKAEEEIRSETGDADGQPRLFQEILHIPAERLKRACGAGHYRRFVAHMRVGEVPPVEESSIVTVTLPWEKAAVKLLEPFAYSTCTCHSKELCRHKAQAVFVYQIQKGKLSLQDLDALQETDNGWDISHVKQTVAGVREAIRHQICTGLSRQSPDVSESMERLAVIAHRASLPDMESGLREAAAQYRQYFDRSAAFRSEELLHKLLMIDRRAQKLAAAERQDEIRPLAGTFRDTYEPVGRLRLTGMGGRTFSSGTGYEGEIYYFLETGKQEWYTWTDARPVFYEGMRRRPPAHSENAPAPWGLNCSREQMETLEFDLLDAKAASGGRLSVSGETRAEIVGTRSFERKDIRQMVKWDYEELLAEHFAGAAALRRNEENVPRHGGERASGRRERLALAGAVRWDETSFDTVRQRFSWRVYDRGGRVLYISLQYGKEERLTISLLERLAQKLQNREYGTYGTIVFFGSLYLDEGGRMCLYPIAFFLEEVEGLLPGMGDSEEAYPDGAQADAKGRESPPQVYTDIMSRYCREAAAHLSDLFVSGLFSVQDDMIERTAHFAAEGESLGLHLAGADFERIAALLREKRHRTDFMPQPVLEAMGRLDACLRAYREKLSYDMALRFMREESAGEKAAGEGADEGGTR